MTDFDDYLSPYEQRYVVSVSNCQFSFQCEANWEELQQTDCEDVRFCNQCKKNVFLVSSDAELGEAIRKDRCVALRYRRDPRGEMLIGMVEGPDDIPETSYFPADNEFDGEATRALFKHAPRTGGGACQNVNYALEYKDASGARQTVEVADKSGSQMVSKLDSSPITPLSGTDKK